MSARREVDEVADRYVEARAALDPYLATLSGIGGHDGEVSALSPEWFAAMRELVGDTLRDVRRAAPVDERERTAQAAMVERLDLESQLLATGVAGDLNVIDSPLQSVRLVFDLVDTGSEAGLALVAERLARTPEALAGYRRTLAEQAATLPPARRQVMACVDQLADWSGSDGFFARLARSGDAPPALRADLERAAAAAGAASDEFARFLREDLAPVSRERDAVGRDRYRLASQYFLGEAVDLDETYAWGWDEMARIEAEMRVLATAIAGTPDLAEAAAALDADPVRTLTGPEDFRVWMQELSDRAVDALAGTHFDIPDPVRRLDCRIAPTRTGGIYYTAPSEDFSRPGTMWWSVPSGLERFATWQSTTTVFHEGIPGHHLQIGQTVYRRELLNRWQRRLCFVSGHAEGWALYAEQLMSELGWLDDPGDRFGMLDAQLFRALRVIVDIGMHLELAVPSDSAWRPGERWTSDLGWEFLRGHSRLPDERLQFELERYLGWPGQAPSYKLGQRAWLAARADAQSRHGEDFDLKAWHRTALDLGPLGLGPLREALART